MSRYAWSRRRGTAQASLSFEALNATGSDFSRARIVGGFNGKMEVPGSANRRSAPVVRLGLLRRCSKKREKPIAISKLQELKSNDCKPRNFDSVQAEKWRD